MKSSTRRRRQADGTDGWSPVDQRLIGDCYLLATLQAYPQSESGRQYLRDQIEWDEEKRSFMVTLYDNGKEVVVPVTATTSRATRVVRLSSISTSALTVSTSATRIWTTASIRGTR